MKTYNITIIKGLMVPSTFPGHEHEDMFHCPKIEEMMWHEVHTPESLMERLRSTSIDPDQPAPITVEQLAEALEEGLTHVLFVKNKNDDFYTQQLRKPPIRSEYTER